MNTGSCDMRLVQTFDSIWDLKEGEFLFRVDDKRAATLRLHAAWPNRLHDPDPSCRYSGTQRRTLLELGRQRGQADSDSEHQRCRLLARLDPLRAHGQLLNQPARGSLLLTACPLALRSEAAPRARCFIPLPPTYAVHP